VGAGIMNCLLGAFSTSLGLHLFSVYAYEPQYRHRLVHSVCLTSPADVERLVARLQESQDSRESSSDGDTGQVVASSGRSLEVRGKPKVHGKEVPLEALLAPAGGLPASEDSEEGGSSEERRFGGRPVQAIAPSDMQPIVVEIQRSDLSVFRRFAIFFFDNFFSVDSGLPTVVTSGRQPSWVRSESSEGSSSTDSDGMQEWVCVD